MTGIAAGSRCPRRPPGQRWAAAAIRSRRRCGVAGRRSAPPPTRRSGAAQPASRRPAHRRRPRPEHPIPPGKRRLVPRVRRGLVRSHRQLPLRPGGAKDDLLPFCFQHAVVGGGLRGHLGDHGSQVDGDYQALQEPCLRSDARGRRSRVRPGPPARNQPVIVPVSGLRRRVVSLLLLFRRVRSVCADASCGDRRASVALAWAWVRARAAWSLPNSASRTW